MFITYHSVLSDSVRPHVLQPTRHLCPWNSLGQDSGVGCHALFQGVFPTQVWNLGLLYCRQTLYLLSQPLQFWLLPSSPTRCCGASTVNPAAVPEATTLAVGNSKTSVTLRRALAACLEEALEGVKCWFSDP